jgi:hypothetical protein
MVLKTVGGVDIKTMMPRPYESVKLIRSGLLVVFASLPRYY